jgi:hypothetical protein
MCLIVETKNAWRILMWKWSLFKSRRTLEEIRFYFTEVCISYCNCSTVMLCYATAFVCQEMGISHPTLVRHLLYIHGRVLHDWLRRVKWLHISYMNCMWPSGLTTLVWNFWNNLIANIPQGPCSSRLHFLCCSAHSCIYTSLTFFLRCSAQWPVMTQLILETCFILFLLDGRHIETNFHSI